LKTNGHIQGYHFSTAYNDESNLAKFLSFVPESFLDAQQLEVLRLAHAIFKARKHFTYTIHENPTAEEQAEIDRHSVEARVAIPKIVNYYMKNPDKENLGS
jgi:hypothetical protein